MKYKHIWLFIVFFFSLSVHLASAKVNFIMINSEAEWSDVLKKAQSEDKIMYVECYSEGCEACRDMDSKTFQDSELSSFFNKQLLAVKINIDSDFGLRFIKKYQIKTLPAAYFMDPAGNRISDEISGYRSAVKLLEAGTYYAGLYNQLMELKARYYSTKQDENTSLSYAYMLLLLKYAEEADVVANQYFKKLNAFSFSPEEWTLIKQYKNDVKDPFVMKFARESAAFAEIYGKEEVNSYLEELFRYNYAIAIRDRNEDLLNTCLPLVDYVDFSALMLTSFPKEQVKSFFRISFFERTENWTKYADEVINMMANFQCEDQDIRNYISNFYVYVSDPTKMQLADSWAKNLLKRDHSFENLVTYALSQHKIGLIKNAHKLLKKAEKKAETNDQEGLVNEVRTQFYTSEALNHK